MNTLSDDLASLRINREKPPSSGRWVKLVYVLALGGALFAAYAFGKPALDARLHKQKVEVTEIVSISPAQDAVDLTATGYVTAQVVARVGAKLTGRIVRVNIKQGDTVKAGDLLFELDAADQKSSVATAVAEVASADARVAAARANLAEIELQHKRQLGMVKQGAATASSAEDLGARVAALEAQVEASRAEAQAKRAQVTALRVGLDNLQIFSPMQGTVLNTPAQVGDIADPGTPLVELADFSRLLVETDVPEARLGMIHNGGPTEIILDSAPDHRYRGEVVEVSPKVNRSKATATVKVRFVDAPERLLPEMSARVSFLAKALDEAQLKEPPKIVVPSNAVAEREGQQVVFIIEDNRVRSQRVSLGKTLGASFELISGPPPGTRIVSNPPVELRDGQTIEEGKP
jgi:HlyD family secretion protein